MLNLPVLVPPAGTPMRVRAVATPGAAMGGYGDMPGAAGNVETVSR